MRNREICPFEAERPQAAHGIGQFFRRHFTREIAPIEPGCGERFFHHVLRRIAGDRLNGSAGHPTGRFPDPSGWPMLVPGNYRGITRGVGGGPHEQDAQRAGCGTPGGHA